MRDLIEKKQIEIKVDKRILPLAEKVFKELSLDLDTAINIYLYQVFYTQSIPFPVKLPPEEMMERFDLYLKIMEGLDDVEAGRTMPADQVFEEIRRELEKKNGSDI